MSEQEPVSLPSSAPINIAEIEAEHGRWLATEGKEGRRANMRGLDFTGMDLSHRVFMEASFRGAILTGANLTGADLRVADLSEALLENANLTGAQLAGASLVRAQMSKAIAIGADMGTADLTGALAESINLTDAKMNGAILRDAHFHHALFTRASLRQTNLRGATLTNADLSNADLSSADCRDAHLDRAIFVNATLFSTNFRGATLADVDLQATDFSNAFEVAAEAMVKSVQTERSNLQGEHTRIASLSADIDKREKMLTAEKERIDNYLTHQTEHAVVLNHICSKFIHYALLWFGFALIVGGFAAYTALQMQGLNTERMGFIIGITTLPLLLSFSAMIRSVQVSGKIKAMMVLSMQLSDIIPGSLVTAQPLLISSEAPAADRTPSFGHKK